MTAQPVNQPVSFPLGRLLATPEALSALDKVNFTPLDLINRHAAGDWGDLCEEDKQANDDALKDGDRILSAYIIKDVKFWVITEADRSATTILLPENY